jgi:hypothetical protein
MIENMPEIKLPTEEELRAAYRQGEDAIVDLVETLVTLIRALQVVTNFCTLSIIIDNSYSAD